MGAKFFLAFGSFLVFALNSASVCVAQSRPAAQPLTLSQLLSWLPADTETVIGANGPFPAPDLKAASNGEPPTGQLSDAALQLQTRSLALGSLNFQNGGLADFVKGKTVSLAIEGSRHFRPPTQLGEMRYEGCLLVVFGTGTTLDGQAFMKNAASSAKRFENIGGTPIAVFEEKQESDLWTTFVAFPRNNVIAVATDIGYLRTVLGRMRGATGPRALPETLSEWKHVSMGAPVWGVRHYQKLGAQLDPSSPLQGRNGANIPDPDAAGVTFWFEPIDRRIAVVNYLSGSSKARTILPGYLSMEDAATASPREFQIRLQQLAPGVLEGTVSLSGEEIVGRLLFGLMAMLGHAIYL